MTDPLTMTYLAARNISAVSSTADESFGPFLNIPGRETFDFTLLFEESILSTLPSTLLLLTVPWRLWYLRNAKRKVKPSYLPTLKLALLGTFAILQVVNVVEISQAVLRTRMSLAAALLTLFAAFALSALSYVEHWKNVRPSSIINVYLLVTLLFDAAQVRTRWLRNDGIALNGVASATLAVKLAILFSEAAEKTNSLLPDLTNISPEVRSGVYSRRMFWWLLPLFRLGFSNVVTEDDLFVSDPALESTTLQIRFQNHWRNWQRYPAKHRLTWVVARAMAVPFAAGVVARLALMFFRFMQPLLIKALIQFVRQPATDVPDSHGWGLTAAFGLVYVGLAVAGGAYEHSANRLVAMVRGSLVSAVYTQTLAVSSTSLEESAAVTLMSSDVERICEIIQPLHTIWSAPTEIALAIWLLQREIGIALVGPLVITAFAVGIPFLIARSMGDAQKCWIEAIQTRIDTTATTLQRMKGVKMLGLMPVASTIITRLRASEIATSLKMRKLLVVMAGCGNGPDVLALGAALSIYVAVASINGQQLDAVSAFTASSLIFLLLGPLRMIVFTVPPLRGAIALLDRIEQFLLLPTKSDHRMVPSSSDEPSDALLPSSQSHSEGIELQQVYAKTKGSSQSPLRVESLTLQWSCEKAPVIRDFSHEFIPGSLTMVVGPVGSGKTSLLLGLLGEIPSTQGHVYMNCSCAAFVSQNPWIHNATIRDNIVGVGLFEPEWYAKVLYGCALNDDLDLLSRGDQTVVGSTGIALSGGQRQRIALARAVYSRNEIVFLDDIFSGLDSRNEDRIFSRLFGNGGLCRQRSTTVLLVTHRVQHLASADCVIALNDQGRLVEEGKFETLVKNSNYVAKLITQPSSHEDEPAVVIPANVGSEHVALENAEADAKRAAGDWSVYQHYFRAVGYRYVYSNLGMMFCYAALLRFPDVWLKFWTSAIAQHGNSVNGLYLGILLSAEVLAVIVVLVAAWLLYVKSIPRSAANLHRQLLVTAEHAPLSFYTATDTGQIINRFSQDLSVVDVELPLAALVLVTVVSASIIQAILVCASAPFVTPIIPVIVLILWILQKFYLRTSRQLRLMDLEAKAPLYSNFLETLGGLVTIRAFGWESDMEKKSMKLLDRSQRPFYLLFCIQRWLALVLDMVVAGVAVLFVALTVKFRTSSDAGLVGVALINIMSFNTSLAETIKQWTAIETSLGAIARIKTFVADTPSEDLPTEVADVPGTWPLRGGIEIKELSAAYSAESPSVLHDVNITIQGGQKVGLCGASGAGKSSFVTLLCRMMEIQQGSIHVDGVDISTVPREVVRSNLSTIPQEPVFIKGTVRENLNPWATSSSPLSDLAAQSVLEKVGLWAIVTAAGGLDKAMNADDLLSHGQRQLFCLARALLNPSRIILLDEPTASVDIDTEVKMMQLIDEHFTDSTVIAIAHRLKTIAAYDRIAVFESGRIIEYGEPGVLLNDERSRFRAMMRTKN